jgi:hypothetical protein
VESEPHVLLDLASIVKQSIAPGSLGPCPNTPITVLAAATGHHHIETITSDQSIPLLETTVAGREPTATVRINVLALNPSTQIDAHPISKIVSPTTTQIG